MIGRIGGDAWNGEKLQQALECGASPLGETFKHALERKV